jgi:hypothetical protein
MAISTITNNSVDAAAAIATSKLGTGAVLQVVNAVSAFNTSITVTNSSAAPAALYGTAIAGRVYGDIVSVAITPKFSTSKFLVLASTGLSAGTNSTNGAFGNVIVVNNTTAIAFGGDYPWYPAATTLGASVYCPDASMTAYYTPNSASTFTVYFKGYAYSEGNTQTTNFRNGVLTVMEIAG